MPNLANQRILTHRFGPVSIVVVLLTSCLLTTLGPKGWCGEELLVDGVVHIRNGAEPASGVETVTLAEIWRAGGEDDDIFFGSIAQVLADDEGHIYVMDSQLCEVHVYADNGEHLKVLSREGDGPGEIRSPGDMFFLPDGTLGMIQSFPGKVVKIDLDGTPAGSMNLSGTDPSQGQFGVLSVGRCRGGNILLIGFRMSFQAGQGTLNQSLFASSCDAEGNELHRYFSKKYPILPAAFELDELGIDFVWGRIALGPDGRVYAAPDRNAYAIHVLTPSGDLERVIEREYKSWQRTDEQKKSARLNLEAVGHYYPYPLQGVTIEDTEPAVGGIIVLEDGSLWVSNSRDNRTLPEGILVSFDVFDNSGHYQKKVHIKGSGDIDRDALFMVNEDKLVLVTGATDAWRSMQAVNVEEGEVEDEATALEVICYELAR